MTIEREILAGVDGQGTPRAPYTSVDLLKRLDREVAENPRAFWPKRKWDESEQRRIEAQFSRSGLTGDDLEEAIQEQLRKARSQESEMMQILTIGLELHTSHHPSTAATFPWLVQWIRKVLAYVIRLEDERHERGESIVRLNQELDAQREQSGTALQEKELALEHTQAELKTSERARKDAERQIRDLTSQLQYEKLRADTAVDQVDAWRIAAKASAVALAGLRPGSNPSPEDTQSQTSLVLKEDPDV